ncbi:MAG: synthase gamma chain [Pseudomonadota bacterium]|jgi:F-type H+-transporting ATPase subunit gamma
MAGNKEIRNKIKSVQNTRKITKAMEMVAASKMRKAQERMRSARPYASKIKEMVMQLMQVNEHEYVHPFMQVRPVKKVGIIAVSTDKGLCGALNTNLLRLLTQQMKAFSDKNVAMTLTTIGAKVTQFAGRIGANVLSQITQLGDVPHLEVLIGAIQSQLDAFEAGEVDQVFVSYTKFINTMKQEAVFEQILPISKQSFTQDSIDSSNISGDNSPKYNWDYIYEPSAKDVTDLLLERYIESLVYQSVAENMASEQSARMVAMKAASDNAKSVIGELQLEYNKSRQASITKELSEIVSGAAAV